MAKYLLANQSTFDSTFDSTFSSPGERRKGSIGGSTFQKIGSVYCIRHRSVPTDKKRIAQTAQRQRFDVVQKFWRTLDSMQKETFSDEIPNYPRVNSLGVSYEISAINLQNVSNTNAINQNVALLEELPAQTPPPAITFDQCDVELLSELITLEINPSSLPSTHSLRIFASRPLRPGLLQPNDGYTFMANVEPFDAPNNVNFFPAYQARFGISAANAGLVMYLALHFISATTLQPDLSIFTVSEPFTLT